MARQRLAKKDLRSIQKVKLKRIKQVLQLCLILGTGICPITCRVRDFAKTFLCYEGCLDDKMLFGWDGLELNYQKSLRRFDLKNIKLLF